MISVEEAQKIVLESARRLGKAKVSLTEALGLVLAEDIVSKEKIPPFDNSAMDGFALIAQDTAQASVKQPVALKILDDEPAGRVSKRKITPGTAIRIMTGAPIPKGADAVVKVEDTKVVAAEAVMVLRPVKKEENIRRAGEDINAGEMVMLAGTALRAPEIGLLASLGKSAVKVFRMPKVAIITTGDELVEVGKPLKQGKIRNSNAYSLYAQVLQAKAEPIHLGIVPDIKQALTAKLTEALKKADVILTTGGVSVGEYDVVKDVLASMGASLKFWKVAQKPGKPFAFWTLKGKLVFGLPGNPVATMVCFEQYVRPSLRKMMGHLKLFRPVVEAMLEEDVKKKPGRLHFVRVILDKKGPNYYASTTGPQGSGILKSMVLANGLALVPADTTLLRAGERVMVQMIDCPEDH